MISFNTWLVLWEQSDRRKHWTYDGLKGLYDYFDSDDFGVDIEDIVGIDCSFAEYSDYESLNNDFDLVDTGDFSASDIDPDTFRDAVVSAIADKTIVAYHDDSIIVISTDF